MTTFLLIFSLLLAIAAVALGMGGWYIYAGIMMITAAVLHFVVLVWHKPHDRQ